MTRTHHLCSDVQFLSLRTCKLFHAKFDRPQPCTRNLNESRCGHEVLQLSIILMLQILGPALCSTTS
ncbi:hypothetical protein MA16_Dca019435 [Dendrobium catenatum]|uniref:Uncharacterized protein n=1 Tax=Dendrobium catenatum TaxID=906689 RepID=A0A2I0WRT7_9ASPA|nr:hypothetical protein MA16_Dca019435 [Dendrobium catenatum]